jgi:hypothetical protein
MLKTSHVMKAPASCTKDATLLNEDDIWSNNDHETVQYAIYPS